MSSTFLRQPAADMTPAYTGDSQKALAFMKLTPDHTGRSGCVIFSPWILQ